MSHQLSGIIAHTTGFDPKPVNNVIHLLESGATIPFISRYRKEQIKGMDEVDVTKIRDELHKFKELESRKTTILKSIEAQDKLTPELRHTITECFEANELEDLYLPFKPRKKTRATIARECGLEPLAKIIMLQKDFNFQEKINPYIRGEVKTAESALQGARDIIAEWINENQQARKKLRLLFEREARIISKVQKGKEEEGEKYKDYFAWEENINKCPSHRILAMFRGEREGILKISVSPPKEQALKILERQFIRSPYDIGKQVEMTIHDAYSRLLKPSLENEQKAKLKEFADKEAIKVFAVNLEQLLMGPPLGQKKILAIDPGYKTGCKIVCLNKQGCLLHNETIYPHPPRKESTLAMKKISSLVEMYNIEAIAIGNGTAGKETEQLMKRIKFNRDIQVFIVNESGASVYSASDVAREEFPNYDITVRGAVSIGRRLMDPLSELVKIDPKSIGVGQYQHDVNQQQLKHGLTTVVERCVNTVGVHLNTASKHLLNNVSGLGPVLAENIVKHRQKKGIFKNRESLKSVDRLGDKAFEQSAGFLRIPGSDNPLDNTAVHPESYPVVNKIAKDIGCTVNELIKNEENIQKIDINNYVTAKTGLPTLRDIVSELSQPGRDPREKAAMFEFAPDIHKIEDLKTGMVVPGIITNITNFGAFVDIGVKQDGLVHISELANEFVRNPADVVKLHQHVTVKVLDIDIPRKRIGLSIRLANEPE